MLGGEANRGGGECTARRSPGEAGTSEAGGRPAAGGRQTGTWASRQPGDLEALQNGNMAASQSNLTLSQVVRKAISSLAGRSDMPPTQEQQNEISRLFQLLITEAEAHMSVVLVMQVSVMNQFGINCKNM